MDRKRRIVSAGSVIFAMIVLLFASTSVGQSQPSEVWQSFAANPFAHPHVPNVMHTGYRGGGVPLPTGAGKGLINVAAAPFNAIGDGVTDTTASLQAALDEAAVIAPQFPDGVLVFIPNGAYRLTAPLFVRSDDTMILGQSRDGVVLRFDESLTTGYASFPGDDGKTRWSGTGGMLWFAGPNRDGPLSGTPTIDDLNDGWRRVAPTGFVAAPASRGQTTLSVPNATSFSVGQAVLIEIDNAQDLSTLRHLLGDGRWAQAFDFDPRDNGRVLPDRQPTFSTVATVAGVSPGTISLREPLRFDLRPEWNPRVSCLGDLRRDVGVARLTIQLNRDYEWTDEWHNREPGFNGVFFGDTIDGFVDDVTILDPGGLAVMLSYSANITVSNLAIDSTSETLERHHHAFVLSRAHNCLIHEFAVRSRPLHGIYLGGFSMGNVYSRGVMEHGAFDYHKGLPYENVITEVVLNNDGSPGGGPDGGPRFGARHVHWNVDTGFSGSRLIAQPDLMPMGVIAGVAPERVTRPVHPVWGDPEAIVEFADDATTSAFPANLYHAQLALRDGLTLPQEEFNFAETGCGAGDTYRFDFGGIVGVNLAGQDRWELGTDLSDVDGDNVVLDVAADHPNGLFHAAASRPGRDSIISRANDASFCYPPISSTAPTTVAQFDLRVGQAGGENGNAYMILTNGDGFSDGIQFGMSDKDFLIRGDRFGASPNISVPIPTGWYARGEWARVRLIIDFARGPGNGRASLFFRNLSMGETAFREAPMLQGVPLGEAVAYPETWDRVELRLRRASAATNLTPAVETCLGDVDGNGVREASDVAAYLMWLAEALAAADVNLDGVADFTDLIEFQSMLETPCVSP